MSSSTTILPFQPATMSTAQLAAVSYLARYLGRTHVLYSFQLRQWFSWCENNALEPLVGIQRAHVELYIRQLGDRGLMHSSVNTMMHAVRGFFRFAHIDGLVGSDLAVYARLPKIHRDESRTQGLDRLELIRFLQIAQTITVNHGALAFLLGINALRASEAAAVRIEDYADTLRGYRVLHLVGKGNKPRDHAGDRAGAAGSGGMPPQSCRRATDPAPDLRAADRPTRRLLYGRPDREDRRHPTAHQPPFTPTCGDHNALDAGVSLRDAQILARHADPRITEHYDRARGNLDRHGVHFLTRLRRRHLTPPPAATPPTKSHKQW